MRRVWTGLVTLLLAIVSFSSARPAHSSGRSKAAEEQAAPTSSHDLSGVWLFDANLYHSDPSLYTMPSDVVPPMTPWGQKQYASAMPGSKVGTGAMDNDPILRCDPPGLPRIATGREGPFEIIQIPGRILILYEWYHEQRQIWMDGRPLPNDPDPTWYGYSVGRWEGDTLIVDTIGFNDKSWLDGNGHPHSDAMQIEERYRRVNHDTLDLTFKITDPKAYTQPWVSTKPKVFKLQPKLELMQLPCVPEEEQAFFNNIREPAAQKKDK